MFFRSILVLTCALVAQRATGEDVPAPTEKTDIVFRSDVALARVDTQVLGRDQRAITGLQAEDFTLLVDGKPQEIRNFGNENMPVDVLMLLDVSGSMRPHIERLTSAAHSALAVLSEQDRVAIMVFDRGTRVRMPFRSIRSEVLQGFEAVVNQEGFNGGTDIARGLLDAARYVQKNARREARRAIVILTDDQSERGVDHAGIGTSLDEANAVLSLLLAPDVLGQGPFGGSRGGRTSGGTVSGWPGASGGPLGGPLGGIIFGRRSPPYGGGGGGGGNGPVIVGGIGTQAAGTGEIARASGGDSMSINNASAFEDTLERIRQRYALHYYLPSGSEGRRPTVEVRLASAASRRYPNSEVRYRRMNISGDSEQGTGGELISVTKTRPAPAQVEEETTPRVKRRRVATDDPVRPMPGNAGPGSIASGETGGWRRADDPVPPPSAPPAAQTTEPQPQTGGWRRVKPGEQP